jgi:hypothetical protein
LKTILGRAPSAPYSDQVRTEIGKLSEHIVKLQRWIADPLANDNKGILADIIGAGEYARSSNGVYRKN